MTAVPRGSHGETALGLDGAWLESAEGIAFLSGQKILEGSQPIALAYAGHQFDNFVPQLGDGSAILLGEIVDADGMRRDLQLIAAAVERDDFGQFEEMLALLSRPYEDQPSLSHYAAAPLAHERITATFCGT